MHTGGAAIGSGSRASGRLASGANWVIEAPAAGNGSALVFAHGYGPGGPDVAAPSALEESIRDHLLGDGYTLAGSSYASSGWAVEDALRDQADLAALVRTRCAGIDRVIAWGHSMGGLVCAGLAERSAEAIDGAVVLCGSVAGPVGMLNQALDAAFVLSVLLPEAAGLPLVEVADEPAARALAAGAVTAGATTPEGRARLALAAAFAQLPTWSQVGPPRPDDDDWPEQARQQREILMWSVFAPRQELERRAGGNFSSNTGVDYARQLATSGCAALVHAMYDQCSLSLDDDLRALASAPRIVAEPAAVDYLRRNLTPTGAIGVPVLTVHCIGDAAPTVSQAAAYASAARRRGAQDALRQGFADRPGHLLSTAEVLGSVRLLDRRVCSGRWPDNLTASLLALAGEDGSDATFVDYEPPPFLRVDSGPTG